MKILVTGGAGFIGSAVVRYLINRTLDEVVVVDKLTYAGNLDSLDSVANNDRYAFEKVDICDQLNLKKVFDKHKPDAVMHLAAESHVDRSITGPSEFITTNIVGTYTLLEVVRSFLRECSNDRAKAFIFHHISTDEVFGDLHGDKDLFTEDTPYSPSSPYSASKASSDHLVRAWRRTYNLPCVITNCSNNYGPYHFPEKLIPLTVLNAIKGQPIRIYGDGSQIRDWLYVDDHAEALVTVLKNSKEGQTYNIGGHNEKSNLEVVKAICDSLEELSILKPSTINKFEDLITFVADRPGHDRRYAIDARKIECELGWVPQESFETGISKTVKWYIENEIWWKRILDGSYKTIKI